MAFGPGSAGGATDGLALALLALAARTGFGSRFGSTVATGGGGGLTASGRIHTATDSTLGPESGSAGGQIGRASCRERVF